VGRPYPAEIYIVAVETATDIFGYGMLAVPVATAPTFTTASMP
jgi:hypothetical protein